MRCSSRLNTDPNRLGCAARSRLPLAIALARTTTETAGAIRTDISVRPIDGTDPVDDVRVVLAPLHERPNVALHEVQELHQPVGDTTGANKMVLDMCPVLDGTDRQVKHGVVVRAKGKETASTV